MTKTDNPYLDFEFAQRRDVDDYVKERTVRVYLSEVLEELTEDDREEAEREGWDFDGFMLPAVARGIAERRYREEF